MVDLQEKRVQYQLDGQQPAERGGFKIRGLRWYIAVLLMFATVLNHMDRNVLSFTAPTLKERGIIDEVKLSYILICFNVTYMIMQFLGGRLIDWMGTRKGFASAVGFWSGANMCHAFAGGWLSLAFWRVLLGFGEGGHYPAAAKGIYEWFSARERSVATGILNVGAGVGGVFAPIITLYLIKHYSWQAPFFVTGAVGFVWVVAWYILYRRPEEHPWITPQELAHIQQGQQELKSADDQETGSVWKVVLKSRNTWAISVARFFTEQPWGFFVGWIAVYLASQRGMSKDEMIAKAWIPFVASAVGSFIGGFISPMFRKMGMNLLTARKMGITIPSLMMISVLYIFRVKDVNVAIALLCVLGFSHQALCASMLSLPGDLMPRRTVATSLGLTGMIGFLGVVVSLPFIGQLAKAGHWGPIFTTMAFFDLIGCAIIWIFVYPDKETKFTAEQA